MNYTTKYTLNAYGEMQAVEVRQITPLHYATKKDRTFHEMDLYSDPDELAKIQRAYFQRQIRSRRNNIDRLNEDIDILNEKMQSVDNFIAELEHHADGVIALEKSEL